VLERERGIMCVNVPVFDGGDQSGNGLLLTASFGREERIKLDLQGRKGKAMNDLARYLAATVSKFDGIH
jgi:hypothetical protein